METDSITLELVYIGICLVLSGFFSGSETALTSLSELKINHMLSENYDRAKPLIIWRDNPNKVLNTILIGNNIVNILGSVLAANTAAKITGSSSIALVTGIMTILVLIFGEITPKTFAKHNAETLGLLSMKLLRLFYIVFYPFTYLINKLVVAFIKISGGSLGNGGPKITEGELEYLVSVGHQEGVLENDKKEMIHNIFDISETYVKEAMVPRTDMMALNKEATEDEIWSLILETEYSRIPVYEGDIDNIIGVLFVKDLVKNFRKHEKIDFEGAIRPPYFVPETKKIDDLLREFQKARAHIAIVIDEYGGVAGIITMEDILEEIVGEIWDEHDVEEHECVQVSDDTYIVDVRMDIDDFCEKFGIEKTQDMEEYETLGGLIFDIADKIPEVGEIYEYSEYRFKILTKHERRLDKIEIKKLAMQDDGLDREIIENP